MATKALTRPPKIKEANEAQVLVLGMGNYLMGDKGIGIHIAQRMELMHLSAYVKVTDIGTGGFLPTSYFEEFSKVIFVDAAMDGNSTGTITHVHAKSLKDFSNTLSVHDPNFNELLNILYSSDDQPEIHLITISIDEVSPMHVGLSEDVDAAIDRAVWKVIDLAETIHLHQ